MKYKTIFFDWGGVIANDPGDEFLGELLTRVGATEGQTRDIFKSYMKDFMKGTISEVDYWQALRVKYNLVIEDSISDEFKKWKGLAANQQVLELVRRSKEQGLKTAVFSNVIEPTYNVIDQAGYYDLFDDVIASCKVGLVKPEMEIYSLALERLGARPEESIFIDDKQSNLEPANALGVTTVLAVSAEQIIHDVHDLLAI
jgi:epoxide hydrolase-like predicted phosphatase